MPEQTKMEYIVFTMPPAIPAIITFFEFIFILPPPQSYLSIYNHVLTFKYFEDDVYMMDANLKY